MSNHSSPSSDLPQHKVPSRSLMHHFKAASLRLQSLNQCGNIETKPSKTEASMNLKLSLVKRNKTLWLFRIFKKPQSKNNDLWDISRNVFWHQRKALWKHRIEILLSPRPHGFGDSVIQVGLPASVSSHYVQLLFWSGWGVWRLISHCGRWMNPLLCCPG